ncbi:MAG: hypothetical protein JHC26_00480 [Thermofilum sp.]|uniref:hypothetical protein n=1 Tax=Thermofilum sp. TaxID=1961369 RepID=UPI00259102D2|nr:hypothetical protein [Thermofilum sp.]MCI4407541.1 hypothetical protein [Thermofilum sp.]
MNGQLDEIVFFERHICRSKEEFLHEIRKAQVIILYANMMLPVFKEFVCSLGSLNMRMIKYKDNSVIEVLSPASEIFKIFWTRRPEIKYYFIDKVNEKDDHGSVIPAKSNEEAEKVIEEALK